MNSAMPGMLLFHVDTIRTQEWIERLLHKLDRGDRGSGSLYAGELHDHQNILQQLLNDASSLTLDRDNNDKNVWERINASIPNDYRDIWRYAYIAMLVETRGAEIMPRNHKTEQKSAVINAGRSSNEGKRW
jgi:hypothetical protein